MFSFLNGYDELTHINRQDACVQGVYLVGVFDADNPETLTHC